MIDKIDLKLGDCLEVMKEIPDKSIDMILCDLPYGTTACKWDNVIPFEPLWEQYNRIIKDNGAIVLFGNEPFASLLRCSNLKMYKYDWIWQKENGTNFATVKYQPFRKKNDLRITILNLRLANRTQLKERLAKEKCYIQVQIRLPNFATKDIVTQQIL